MFGRSKSDTTTEAPPVVKPGGKGRPTPTRKEAEAAARARAKVPRTRREQAQAQRAARVESSQKVRKAMKEGDERYFLARDRGPVRSFIRDFVDVRFSFIELMIPLLIITMILTYSGNATLAGIGNTILFGTLLLVVLDMVFLRFKMRRELKRRFPDTALKGTTYYALTRALQMKFMRLPKAKV
ncbi:MAG: DUF3043 domain-containing protein, partial [Nocardioides sp.]|nr:DUF3043 domain-containing protein [Nocardioides sp.]